MSFDPEVVGQLRELGGDALVHKLFRTFIDHAPVRRQALSAATESRDREGLARAVHSLRSSSAMLGLSGLSELAGRLEALAEAGRLEELVAGLPELEAALDRAVALLEAELERADDPGRS